MIRLLTASALAAAALATPAAAVGACTPASRGPVDLGACVDVVCLKLCVTQIDVDPHCSIHHPVPLPVAAVCSHVDRQHFVVGGG